MAVVQSTYTEYPQVGYPGMVANGERANIISRTVEDGAGIAFGKAAFRGTHDHGCTGTPAADKFLGFVVSDKSITPVPGGVAADIVPETGTAGIITKGAIWVTAGEAVTAGADVYISPTNTIVATEAGNIAAPGWVFDTTAGNGAHALVVNRG